MHEVYTVRFSGRKIIAHFGGVKPTFEAMQIAGSDIGEKTVQKWKERDIMTADAVASLMWAAKHTGVPFDPYDFIQKG